MATVCVQNLDALQKHPAPLAGNVPERMAQGCNVEVPSKELGTLRILHEGLKKKTISEFQFSVYAALLNVPRGFVTTYGGLAHAVRVNSARAIGQALRRNPYAPAVPCHRVVRHDGSLGGFQGRTAGTPMERKRALLVDEGIRFESETSDVIARECIYVWPHCPVDGNKRQKSGSKAKGFVPK